MKKTISLILPSFSKKDAKTTSDWVDSLTELQLLAPVKVNGIQWSEKTTGLPNEWLNVANAIKKDWTNTSAFIVWAPESSLLQLAGTLFLIFGNASKPIILFSAPDPAIVNRRKFAQLAIKSTLINASFAAQSDLGEVVVLSENKLFRPPGCFWGFENKDLLVKSSFDPLATIDFALKFNSEFKPKEKTKLPDKKFAYSKELEIVHWFPGLESKYQLNKSKLPFIIADSAYWGHPEVEKLRSDLASKGIATIWFSNGAWQDAKFKPNELGISHPQSWWGALATQFYLGQHRDQQKALKALEKTFK